MFGVDEKLQKKRSKILRFFENILWFWQLDYNKDSIVGFLTTISNRIKQETENFVHYLFSIKEKVITNTFSN